MSIAIRRAEPRDIEKVSILLSEVLELHAKLRPGYICVRNDQIYSRRADKDIFRRYDAGIRRRRRWGSGGICFLHIQKPSVQH